MTRTPAQCGTPAAYQRHIRRGEPIDQACREANTSYQRDYWRRRRTRNTPPPAPAPARYTVRWLLPPPGGSTPLTEYARLNHDGNYEHLTPDQAGELLEAGNPRVYVRTVSLWTRIAADPSIGSDWLPNISSMP